MCWIHAGHSLLIYSLTDICIGYYTEDFNILIISVMPDKFMLCSLLLVKNNAKFKLNKVILNAALKIISLILHICASLVHKFKNSTDFASKCHKCKN